MYYTYITCIRVNFCITFGVLPTHTNNNDMKNAQLLPSLLMLICSAGFIALAILERQDKKHAQRHYMAAIACFCMAVGLVQTVNY